MTASGDSVSRVLATNAFWILLSHVLSRGSLMLGAVFLARTMATREFATYSYFQATIAMIATYASIGLGATSSRYFAELGSEHQGSQRFPLGTLWIISIIAALFGAIAVMLVPVEWLSAGLDFQRSMLAIGVFFAVALVVPGGAVLGLELYRQTVNVSALVAVIMLLGLGWASLSGSITIAMATLLLAFAAQMVGETFLVVQRVGWKLIIAGTRLGRQEISQVFSFAGPMFLVSILYSTGGWLLGRSILQESGSREFALYSIGMQWFALAMLVPGLIARVVLPDLVRASNNSANVAARHIVAKGLIMAIVGGLICGVVAVMLGPWLIGIYGEHYNEGRWFIGAFVGAAVLTSPVNVFGSSILANNRQVAWLACTAAWFAVLIVVGLIGSGLGAWWGAFAQSAASIVLVCLAYREWLRTTRKLMAS